MVSAHPFQILFESFGRLPVDHAENVNREAYETLLDVLKVPTESVGRCVLLRAPRAGHGKTHLLSRLQHQLVGSHEFISLQPSSGTRITASTVIEDAIRRLTRTLPASGGLTAMDLLVRKLFAFSLQPLVRSGEVPCQDRDGALGALKNRPIETFDFHHPNAVTAQWARENFEVLGPRLGMELAQQCGIPVRDVTFWLDSMFRFASTPLDYPSRMQTLAQAVLGAEMTEGVAMDRLEAILGLLASQQRVVLVADELEGFSADETAALKLSAFIGALRQSVDRLDVILSLNQDIWDSAFLPRLSGGLADRLSEVLVELKPLSEDEIIALLNSRAPGLGEQVRAHIDTSDLHARGLIRAAGEAWVNAARARSSQPVEPISEAPVAEPTVPAAQPVEPEVEYTEVEYSAPTEAEIAPPEPPAEPELPAEEEDFSSPFTIAAEPAVEEKPVDSPFMAVAEVEESSWEAPVEDSPFQIAEEPVVTEVEPAFEPEKAPSPFEAIASDASPFTAVPDQPEPAQPEEDLSQPIFEEKPPIAEETPVQSQPDTAPKPSEVAGDQKRVDDLLRQFRERYGRGSL
ncbi:hypothetical protein JIN85_06835 [Luteolibacter pohnpeiensis]|uniref:Orc1-like AAA ATPase domain-containing protein n=1 Tax=Luteolibacter pohnpeiensis TaxID=454153 RepID=A0A934S7A9_9BACT|nr:hypothetical protein [Luteolibacter pohnpeiensis]MBK1882121.1 hypothetical protein [Luteolibacter pohnpeiensis]